jgi:hypothetical protein
MNSYNTNHITFKVRLTKDELRQVGKYKDEVGYPNMSISEFIAKTMLKLSAGDTPCVTQLEK